MRYTVALLLALAVAAHALRVPAAGAADGDHGLSMRTFEEIVETIEDSYVRDVERGRLLRDAVEGMMSGLDAHSAYLDPQAFENMQVSTQGRYGGLGLRVAPREDGLIEVVAPIGDSPAARSRISPGDLIVAVGETPTQQIDFTEAVQRMRGEPGTPVTLHLRRGKDERYSVELERARITVEPVTTQTFQRIGYVRVTTFNEQAADALRAALDRVRQDVGGELRGLVLDLRNNPGGLLDQGVAVTDLLLGAGEIVRVGRQDGDRGRSYVSDPDQALTGVPMVVLINRGSASASEIVAGALQDHGRARVVGSRSFGKGSVQTVKPLEGGGALRLTTAHYMTPSGDRIGDQGIVPDIEVTARESGEDGSQPARIDTRGSPAERLQRDRQLARAVEILRGGAAGDGAE